MPEELTEAIEAMGLARCALLEAKHATETAKELASQDETSAIMEAYEANALDGKNAEQRKVQLDAYLSSHEMVAEGRRALEDYRDDELAAACSAEMADGRVKSLSYGLRAAIASAELLGQILAYELGTGEKVE